MLRRLLTGITMSIAAISLVPAAAFAHVVVTPAQAGIGQELTFTMSVPNEQNTAITSLKLDIPDGVMGVIPTTKDGWTITTTKNGDTVTQIMWTDGKVPVGERQDFTFNAQVPAKASDLDWKAFQTYADGTTVHWDQTPAGSDDATGNAGPYSVTHITDDLTASPKNVQTSQTSITLPLVVSVIALVVSLLSVLVRRKS